MAEGFRVTEDGSLRVTESLDPRITQNYAPLYADSSLTAVGTQIFVAGLTFSTSSSLTGALSNLNASTFTAGAVSSMTSSGSVNAAADLFKNFIANLTGTGSVSAKLGYRLDTSTGFTSVATLTLQPKIIRDVLSTLNGSLSLSIIPTRIVSVIADIQTEGYCVPVPTFIATGRSSGQANGSLIATGSLTTPANANLQASTTFNIHPMLIQAAASLVGGTGQMLAFGGFLASGEANLNANGILNGNMIMIHNAIVTAEDLRRSTENGDTRITESGEFRASFATINAITSFLNPTPTIIPFSGQIFGHRNGAYHPVRPSVKRGGVWVDPRVYVKNNGTWKRVY